MALTDRLLDFTLLLFLSTDYLISPLDISVSKTAISIEHKPGYERFGLNIPDFLPEEAFKTFYF